MDPDVLFIDDHDVLTSAGVAAGIDLCLHVIRRDHGREVANAHPLEQLAVQARMSVRTFTRRFRDEVGVSPGSMADRTAG